MALTTLAYTKDQMQVTLTSAQDTVLTNLIDAASEQIETLCDREFESTERVEFLDALNGDTVDLPQTPVIDMYRMAIARDTSFTITYTGSDLAASVSVSGGNTGKIVLFSDTAGATDVTFASNATVSAVKTAVEAVTGWAVTIENDAPSKYLVPMAGQDAKDTSVSVYYGSDTSGLALMDLNAGIISVADYGDNARYLIPYGARASLGNSAFASRPTIGMGLGGYNREVPTPAGRLVIMAHYKSGYATIPADLQQACAELAIAMYWASQRDLGVQSENIGSYSYTNASGDVAANMGVNWNTVIAKYSKVVIA